VRDVRVNGESHLSPGARKYALSLLFLIFAFNFLDRQIVNILAEPIKRDLSLADWQLGVLTGLSFAAFYVALALPIARYAERADRVKLISAAVVVWSVFTAACSLATSFIQLLLARIGVGIGEAGCTPASHSLITDYVSRDRRASSLAYFSLGIPVGSLFGLAIGGLLADSHGWRLTFLAAGLPGLVLGALAYATLPEPRRNRPTAGHAAHGHRLADAVREIGSKRALHWLTAGTALTAFIGFGQQGFYGSFFLRAHAVGLETMSERIQRALEVQIGPTALVGILLGLILGVFGAIGTWLGGALADRAARRDARAYAVLPALAAVAGVPFFVLAMLTPSTPLAFLLITGPALCGTLWYGPVFDSVQSLVGPHTRATAAAVLLLVTNLVGLGFGPLTVGVLSDAFAETLGAADGIRWALIALVGAAVPACAAYLAAARTLRAELSS
jgi:MFS family permease